MSIGKSDKLYLGATKGIKRGMSHMASTVLTEVMDRGDTEDEEKKDDDDEDEVLSEGEMEMMRILDQLRALGLGNSRNMDIENVHIMCTEADLLLDQ